MEDEQLIQPGPPTNYAGFWLRFAAFLIDGVALAFPYCAIFLLTLVIARLEISTKGNENIVGSVLTAALFPLLMLAVFWLYFALMESSSLHATLGKKILRLYVTDLQGRRLTFGRSTARTFAKILSIITIGIGFILCGFTHKKQALHDIIASCLVLRG